MAKKIPTRDQLAAYLDRGLTDQEIADAWAADGGDRVQAATIRMAIARYELRPSRS